MLVNLFLSYYRKHIYAVKNLIFDSLIHGDLLTRGLLSVRNPQRKHS